MKKRIGLLILLLTVLAVAVAAAGTYVNEGTFPDPAFRQYVTSFATNMGQGYYLSDEAIAAVKTMDCREMGISSLKGIEFFTALEELDCVLNSIETLDMSGNPALKELNCDLNKLTSLNVSQNAALETLVCGVNQLTKLDVSNNTSLDYLSVLYNSLTGIDLSKNKALTKFECSWNKITSLDLSNNTALVRLECEKNRLKKLDIGKNTALKWVRADKNLLTSLDTSNNKDLEQLTLEGNSIGSLDLSSNTKLKELDCDRNKLKKLDLRKNTKLETLYCCNNGLTSLELGKKANLSHMNCYDNKIVKLDVRSCTVLSEYMTKYSRKHDDSNNHDYFSIRFIFDPLTTVVGPYTSKPTAASASTPVINGLRYKLSGSKAVVTGAKSDYAKELTIPDKITANGKTYKVTEIKGSAFKDMKKLTKVTIGSNIKLIGENAFRDCAKLKTITIKTDKLKAGSVKANAFTGIYKKATFYCPKGKAKAYKKILVKAGAPKTCKFK